jgi:hypothetical protein
VVNLIWSMLCKWHGVSLRAEGCLMIGFFKAFLVIVQSMSWNAEQ